MTGFTKKNIKDAVKGAGEAGITVGRVDIGHNGQIVIYSLEAVVDNQDVKPLEFEPDGIDKWRHSNVVKIV